MKNDIYIATDHVPNTAPGNYEGWTCHKHLPPKPGEWDGESVRLNRFFFKVEDYILFGRRYQTIVWSGPEPEWRTGYFIGEVPSKEHFPDIDQATFNSHFRTGRWWCDEPAPQAFLDVLTPAPGITVDAILTKYEGSDGRKRIDRSPYDPRNDLDNDKGRYRIVFKILSAMCDGRDHMIEQFESELRAYMVTQARYGEFNGVQDLEEEVRAFLQEIPTEKQKRYAR